MLIEKSKLSWKIPGVFEKADFDDKSNVLKVRLIYLGESFPYVFQKFFG